MCVRVLQTREIASNPEDDTLFLKFPGEDPFKNDRVKAQQLQQQEWLAQQLSMLREKEERERAEDA